MQGVIHHRWAIGQGGCLITYSGFDTLVHTNIPTPRVELHTHSLENCRCVQTCKFVCRVVCQQLGGSAFENVRSITEGSGFGIEEIGRSGVGPRVGVSCSIIRKILSPL